MVKERKIGSLSLGPETKPFCLKNTDLSLGVSDSLGELSPLCKREEASEVKGGFL